MKYGYTELRKVPDEENDRKKCELDESTQFSVTNMIENEIE